MFFLKYQKNNEGITLISSRMDWDDWDAIDWDEKVETIIKQRAQDTSETVKFLGSQDDGNYYEANQEKKKNQQKKSLDEAGLSKKPGKSETFQSYSYKDLQRIREHSKSSLTINNLIYETFGQLERFLLTHKVDLTDDVLVELLIIDTSLLEIPFNTHNQVLLKNISKIESFWAQILKFIEKFLSNKSYQDEVKFLLAVDMNGFFNNIELMLHNLIVSNLFNVEMENVFKGIIDVMERFALNKWSCAGRLKNIHESYKTNRDVFKIYDVSFVNFRKVCDEKWIIYRFFLPLRTLRRLQAI